MVLMLIIAVVAFAQPSDKLTVHLIPHSHAFEGLTETFETYYDDYSAYGGVRQILTNVVQHLRQYPDSTFVYSSISFFARWWDDQIDVTKDHVKELVKQGRLEFVNGGWTEHDEATPYYHDMLDNMAVGHQFLLENFGIRPTVGWLPESYGHSAAIADLYPKMGLNSLFCARIDHEDKAERIRLKSLEFLWSPEQGSGAPEDLFTHILDHHYDTPEGFKFDRDKDNYMPIYSDALHGHQNNIKMKTVEFMTEMREKAQKYQSNHILLPMGDDFGFKDADENYRNMDLLIDVINSLHDDVTLVYSTPSNYIQAVNSQNFTFPTKTDDFFPYSDRKASFYTGFYTTRPAFKKFVRTAGSLLRASQNFLGHKLWKDEIDETKLEPFMSSLSILKDEMALVQQHGVAGTVVQQVVQDYTNRLNLGLNKTIDSLIDLVEAEILTKTGVPVEYEMCPLRNVSICGDYEKEAEMNVGILNPRYHTVTQLFSVPISWTDAQVYDDLGYLCPSDLV